MYNLCSERTYDTHHFIGCTVERFMIHDHNVPTLEDMLRFAKSVKGKISFSSKISPGHRIESFSSKMSQLKAISTPHVPTFMQFCMIYDFIFHRRFSNFN